MTVKQCYDTMGGNYEEAIGRLMTDDRIKKYLGKFLNDTSFNNLCDAMEDKNAQEAFKAVHNLKGVSANLSLTSLYEPGEKLTEILRAQVYSNEAEQYFEQLKKNYQIVQDAIEALVQGA